MAKSKNQMAKEKAALKLVDIVKTYGDGENAVQALKGVNITFRKNEFVSVLGPSGCGKTTMLNIIGGLDRYSSGDLIINGVSTKEYKDRDWDTYRNNSIGFVFQSYNLIPHQTGCVINIDEEQIGGGVSEGVVDIAGTDKAAMDKALEWINGICAVPEVGTVYHGKVVSILEFGAFVEILPGKEGLLHISELDWKKTDKVEDILQVGDEVDVKLLEIDAKTGKMRLSRRALFDKPEGYVEPERRPRGDRGDRGPRREGDRRDDRRGPRRDDKGPRGPRRDERPRREERREEPQEETKEPEIF